MAYRLSIDEKEAISAIMTELFRAESIVAFEKLRMVNEIMNETYQISSRTIKKAKCLTLEKAVSTISLLDLDFKKEFLSKLYYIAKEDGFCSQEEAIFLESLKYALIPRDGKDSVEGKIFSMRSNKLNFDGRKACYIHPHKNMVDDSRIQVYSDKISRHLDELVLLFYCFGYDFVFIPQLRRDFGYDEEIVQQLLSFSFFFTDLPKQNVEQAIRSFGDKDESRRFTSAKFANILFSGRENDFVGDHNSPAFLIKISDSFIKDEVIIQNGGKETISKKYYNFLYLPIVADGISGIIDTVKVFFQSYTDRVDRATCIVTPEPNHRLRHFDLYQSLIAKLAKDGINRCTPIVVIDCFNEELVFKEVVNGQDIIIDFKSYIAEYLFVLWWTQQESGGIQLLESSYGELDENDVLIFVRQILNKDRTEDRFKHLGEHIRALFQKKGLHHYLDNFEAYIPRRMKKEQGIRGFRLGYRAFVIREFVNGKFEEKSLLDSQFNSELTERLISWYNN